MRRLLGVVLPASVLAAGLLLAGCAHPPPLTLTGPKTDVAVTIPDGWHQVINSANPVIPEMVSPTTCAGADEVSCALGLARTATLPAKSLDQAVDVVRRSVLADRRIVDATDVSKGPAKLAGRDGYRYRFTFRNPKAKLTCEIAALPTGPPTPGPNGDSPYSVVLVWVSDNPNSPKVDVIDQIVGSIQVVNPAQNH